MPPLISGQEDVNTRCCELSVVEKRTVPIAKVVAICALKNAPDHLLLELIGTGHKEGIATMYNRYLPLIKKWITMINRKQQQYACDLAHDIFIKIMEANPQTEIIEFESYLFRMVKNALLNEEEKSGVKYKYASYIRNSTSGYSNITEEEILSKELSGIYSEGVDKLPSKMKLAYDLKKQSGFKIAEISNKMGISDSAVKTHVQKATKKVQSFVSNRYS